MKKLILSLALVGAVGVFSSSNEVKADVETTPCGNALLDYKKQWFSTNCKEKSTYTCLLRCEGPKLPDISL